MFQNNFFKNVIVVVSILLDEDHVAENLQKDCLFLFNFIHYWFQILILYVNCMYVRQYICLSNRQLSSTQPKRAKAKSSMFS